MKKEKKIEVDVVRAQRVIKGIRALQNAHTHTNSGKEESVAIPSACR